MIHYHVWFDLRPDIEETRGLKVVADFLATLDSPQEATSVELLRNKGQAPSSRLAAYHALIRFRDDAQLGEAMRQQSQRGIHSGLHGEVIDVVTNFHVEVFETIG